MRCAQAGDRVAYVALLAETARILKRVVQGRAWFLPASDREDLVQDILLSLHAARATYDPERPFLPWLMSVARNRIIDNARRNSRRFSNELLVDEIPKFIADDGAGVSRTNRRFRGAAPGRQEFAVGATHGDRMRQIA